MLKNLVGRLIGTTVWLLTALHLRWLLSGVVHRLPPPVRLRLGGLQVGLGYMQGLTLVPEDDLQRAFEGGLKRLHVDRLGPGSAYLEFGVYVGTSMACMYRAAATQQAVNLKLIGFDSFQGMPRGVEQEDDGIWHEGELISDIELTRRNLRRLGVPLERIELVEGWFDETLTEATRLRLGIDRAAIIMIDCVVASSTRTALEFVRPLIQGEAIVFLDDWSALDLAERGLGERLAFEEWLATHNELSAEPLPELDYSKESRAFLVRRRSGAPPEGIAPGA